MLEKTSPDFIALLEEVINDLGKGDADQFAEWEHSVRTLFPNFAKAEFSDFQREFWGYVWQLESGKYMEPVGLFLPRGQAKSTTAEMATVLLGATGKRKFAVYCCASQDRANEHVSDNIRAMLESPEIQKHFPEIGTPRVGLHGNQSAWRQTELICANGFKIRALGFDGAMRGIKIEGERPDLIILDDIDDINDGMEMVLKRERVLTRSIIPAKSVDAFFIFAQNLIHPQSVATKVARKQAEYFRRMKRIGPHPAIRNLEWEFDEAGDPVITGGVPTWPQYMGLEVCQQMMLDMGPSAFLTECQQEVDEMAAGSIYPMWNENLHIVTHSELRAYFPEWFQQDPDDGRWVLKIPDNVANSLGHDWGATMKHPAVASLWIRPGESPRHDDNMLDCVFKVCEIVAPLTKDEIPKMTGKYFGEKMITELSALIEVPNIRNMTASHDANSERHTYQRELSIPMPFASTGGSSKRAGVDQLRVHYAVDFSKPHPFARWPQGHPLAGQPLMGRPRAYWVVPDDEGRLVFDPETGETYRMLAKTQAGMKRGRWEIPRYHWEQTGAGIEREMPHAMDEDAMCADRYACMNFLPKGKKLSMLDATRKSLETKYPVFLESKEGFSERQQEDLLRAEMYLMGKELQETKNREMVGRSFRMWRFKR